MSRRNDSSLLDISSQSLSPPRNQSNNLVNSISKVSLRREIGERLKYSPLYIRIVSVILKDLAVELYASTHSQEFGLRPLQINAKGINSIFAFALLGCEAVAKGLKFHSCHRRIPDIETSDDSSDEDDDVEETVLLQKKYNKFNSSLVKVKLEKMAELPLDNKTVEVNPPFPAATDRSSTAPQSSNEVLQDRLVLSTSSTQVSDEGRHENRLRDRQRRSSTPFKLRIDAGTFTLPTPPSTASSNFSQYSTHSVQSPHHIALQGLMVLINSRELEIALLVLSPVMAPYSRILFQAGFSNIQLLLFDITDWKSWIGASTMAALSKTNDTKFLFELVLELNALRSRSQ